MISLNPGLQALRRRLGVERDFMSTASERWVIAPPSPCRVQQAYCLPGQLDKIRDVEFTTHDELVRNFKGGFETLESATMGLRFKDVDLVDGVLYSAGASRHLRQRPHARPFYRRPAERLSASMYESWNGNRWFGTWLLDDCLAHGVAAACGPTVTTAPKAVKGHVARYEQIFGIESRRVTAARFDALTLIDDGGNNDHKRLRWSRMREALMAAALPQPPQPHAGVFLLRGTSGDRRFLRNERAVAERLARHRGLKIIDPSASTVEEVVEACSTARVIAGVEGSHLVHGMLVMPSDAVLLVVMPPYRVVSALKLVTDRQGQRFAFVVGDGEREDFDVDADDVERTLDLALA